MIETYFNSTNGPVVVDDEGHVIGAQEWDALDSTSKVVKAAVKKGWLVKVEEPEQVKRNSPAADAFKEAEKENKDLEKKPTK